jgi:hypothetical protein
MPIACTAIIFLRKYFSFDPLNNTAFRNSWPVWLCCIFKNYLMQTEGFLGGGGGYVRDMKLYIFCTTLI